MDDPRVQRVGVLLEQAGSAHSVFEKNELKGVRDQDWPAWYARYLVANGLDSLVGHAIDEDALASLLRECESAYLCDAPQEPWPAYYARLIARA